jgi:hypothetical protein
MASQITGKVTFANGLVARGVQVRVFDRDAPGKVDDDLTIQPGLTDERGMFTVQYDPGRYMDFASLPFIGLRSSTGEKGLRIPDLLDILMPYLQFRYVFEGQERVHTAPVELFKDRFELPHSVPLHFVPSRDAFQFPNAFKGYMLPFSVPFLSDTRVSGVYGLCGGMSAAACDFLLAGKKIHPVDQVPRRGQKLHRYLFRRAIDSFAMGESILRFARWMLLPDEGFNGTYRLTMNEWEKIRAGLDDHRLVPVGQLRAKANNIQEVSRKVWDNHQVLAYGYTAHPDGSLDIQIYDPNCPKDDHVLIHADRIVVGEESGAVVYGLVLYEQDCGAKKRPLHGMFAMPYSPIDPPEDL